ncbi:zinc finger CCHC domain-containing protein 2-like isoform X2 [Acanthaster planci]|uniref:Zinc finger CCHC domain-containing protein 2-like isoform X2 n=1 Tax=Acanthaster planci TaxID=133434 RepID=A0A8B7ZR25_ACAPL|nr:zinc finger CCHC domain-containing protein 2-like isoform X2 [Acanthaster planci]
MVCKKEVINWFRDLSACRRIEFLCALMDCCGPLELRFLGTYIEDLGRRDYDRLREMELHANNVNYLSKLTNISDIRILDKVLTSLALMYSTCKDGARVLFKTLKEHTDTILNGAGEPCSETHEKVVLLAVMALNHPAFSFSEKQALRSQLYALLQAVESIAAAPSEDCDDGVNSIITGEQKEPSSQVLAAATVAQANLAESNSGDTVEEGPSCHNDSGTALESKKNCSPPDADNPVFIRNIEGKGLTRRQSDKRYEYTFVVHWLDGTVTNIRKTHGQMQDFHYKLTKLFPEEAREQKYQDRVIPCLPGKRNFSSAHKGELAERMLPEIAEYAKQLSALPQHILQCELTCNFFRSSESSEMSAIEAGKMAGQMNPTASDKEMKSSTSPTQVYQQLPQHLQQLQLQQQQYPLLPDMEPQHLHLHYQQQLMTHSLQQQQQQHYHGQMVRQQQQSPYSQASLPPLMVQSLSQHPQPLQQQPPSIHLQQLQQQQGDMSVHHGQPQPGQQQQGAQSSKNQSHPAATSQMQQQHSVPAHYPEYYAQLDSMPTSKANQVMHQQSGKFSNQQHQQQQPLRQLQPQQQTDSGPSRRTQSDPTPPPSQPPGHHNLTALVSQMHISQHHQVNLSTPNIPPAAVSNSSNSSSSSLGVCQQGTSVTSSMVTTTAGSSSVYYQTVTSIGSVQNLSPDPITTTGSTGSSQQHFKATSSKEQTKHPNNTSAYVQNPPMSKPVLPTYTASLMPNSAHSSVSLSPSHSQAPTSQNAPSPGSRPWPAPPNSSLAQPISSMVRSYYGQLSRDNVDPLIHEWLKKQRLHKYTKFFEWKSFEQVLQLSDKEVDSWDIVQGAKGRIKSQLEQLRQKGLTGLNGMSQIMAHTPPPSYYYHGQVYPPLSSAMLSQMYASPGVGGEGTGSEGSSSSSSPRESSDENERESEGSEGSVMSSPDARSMAGVNRDSNNQQKPEQQLTAQDNNSFRAATPQVNQYGQPQMSTLLKPQGNLPPGNPQNSPQANSQAVPGSPLSNPAVGVNYNYGAVGPSPNVDQLPMGSVDLRRLIDSNQRQSDCRLTPVPTVEMATSSVKVGSGSHTSSGGGGGGPGATLARPQLQVVSHLGDLNMMGVPPPNMPPPLPSHNQMDIGANIPPQVVGIKQQQQQQQPSAQQQQPSIPGIQYSIECADSSIFKMPSIVVPDVVPTSTVSPGLSVPSSLPLTARNEGPAPTASGATTPRILPSPVNPNFPGSRAGFAPHNAPVTFGMRHGGEQYQAPTSVTYVTSMAQSPSINLANSNIYDSISNSMMYNSNNQGGYSVGNPGCTSCGCSGQCGTSGMHHGPVHHLPLQGAYPSGQVAYQNIPNFFPSNLPGMPPPSSVMPPPIPGSPRFPGPMLPFQNVPSEMAYGGNSQFGLMPHGQMYMGGMGYGHRNNHGSHTGQGGKKRTCYNCGGVGHRPAECQQLSMESITQNSLYRLNFKPVPDSNLNSDS